MISDHLIPRVGDQVSLATPHPFPDAQRAIFERDAIENVSMPRKHTCLTCPQSPFPHWGVQQLIRAGEVLTDRREVPGSSPGWGNILLFQSLSPLSTKSQKWKKPSAD